MGDFEAVCYIAIFPVIKTPTEGIYFGKMVFIVIPL